MIAAILTKKEFFSALPETYEAIKVLSSKDDEIDFKDVPDFFMKNTREKFPLEVVEIPIFSGARKIRKNISSHYYVLGLPWKAIPKEATKEQVEKFILYYLRKIFSIYNAKIEEIHTLPADDYDYKEEYFYDYYYLHREISFREFIDVL
jgi:hypothetical protein